MRLSVNLDKHLEKIVKTLSVKRGIPMSVAAALLIEKGAGK